MVVLHKASVKNFVYLPINTTKPCFDYYSILQIIYQMRMLLLLLLCTLSVYPKEILCDLYVANTTLAHFQCIKQTNDDLIIFININQTGIYPSNRQAFINARSAGLKLQIVMNPCRSLNPQQHVYEIIKKLGLGTASRIWIFPSDNQINSCSWKSYQPEANCVYLQSILSMLKLNGFKTGVGALADTWETFFGSIYGCPQVARELLGWVPSVHQQDSQPALEPYYKVGGWEKPYMKFFDVKAVCGWPHFKNYYE